MESVMVASEAKISLATELCVRHAIRSVFTLM